MNLFFPGSRRGRGGFDAFNPPSAWINSAATVGDVLSFLIVTRRTREEPPDTTIPRDFGQEHGTC